MKLSQTIHSSYNASSFPSGSGIRSLRFSSPVGEICLYQHDGKIIQICEADPADRFRSESGLEGSDPALAVLVQAEEQILEYLDGKRSTFTFPWQDHGTPFQLAVRQACLRIPCGQTLTYGQLADAAGFPGAARAAASAMSHNPLPFLIPCHRVVPSSGRNRRYSFLEGEKTRQFLLALEKNMTQPETCEGASI